MPPVKARQRETTKKPVKKAVRGSGRRTMSDAHKQALAEGRTMSATVNRYLAVINTPKRRGRKVSRPTMERRLRGAQSQVKSATGVEKVVAAQTVRDLQTRLSAMTLATSADEKRLEADFVKIAKRFGENRGISYGAWRDAGVPAVVLKKAGIARVGGNG